MTEKISEELEKYIQEAGRRAGEAAAERVNNGEEIDIGEEMTKSFIAAILEWGKLHGKERGA